MAWSPANYLRFEGERTRPARDLLAAVPLESARRAVDLGCGPGNSTQLLVERFGAQAVSGLDSSPEMLVAARERLPGVTFFQADLDTWEPDPGTDLLYSNAVFQWVPDRETVLARLARALPPGGVIAVQMPDNVDEPSHRVMDIIASDPKWAGRLSEVRRKEAFPIATYYDLMRRECAHVDIWRTAYQHVLDDRPAIADWVKSTGLRPFLEPLEPDEREEFTARYVEALAEFYPTRVDGRVILAFPRLFFVAVR